ncbi:MAG: hypothetical protein LBH82_05175 [Bacteroidales bacterium]|jgi:hypothetical protein|nr:hypothetical protein [Bacteroidales bacterium]
MKNLIDIVIWLVAIIALFAGAISTMFLPARLGTRKEMVVIKFIPQ